MDSSLVKLNIRITVEVFIDSGVPDSWPNAVIKAKDTILGLNYYMLVLAGLA